MREDIGGIYVQTSKMSLSSLVYMTVQSLSKAHTQSLLLILLQMAKFHIFHKNTESTRFTNHFLFPGLTNKGIIWYGDIVMNVKFGFRDK